MIFGSLVWVGGLIALSLADLMPAAWMEPWIVVTRLVASGGLALNAVSSQPYLTAVTSPPERPLAFALSISLRPLGGFVGSLVGGFLPGLFVQWSRGPLTSSLVQPRPFGLTLAAGMLIYGPVAWALWTLPRDVPTSASRLQSAGAAVGREGQFIIVIPELEIVVVFTANVGDGDQLYRLVQTQILPAVAER
ncbi:MAG: hypothetical protein ACP5HG_14480 [Anaerolineae bacterium]